jgi:DNA primase large subunit
LAQGLQLGLDDLAKYPFLPEAGEFIKHLNLSIEELGEDDYANLVKRAYARILEAQRKGRISEEFYDGQLELLSFHIALILVKAVGLEHLFARFSLAESMRVEKLLEQEGNKSLVAYIFRSLLGIELVEVKSKFGVQKFGYKIPVIEYLKRAVHFHAVEWKLINRMVDNGYVYLNISDLIRLIRESIRMIIFNRIRSASVPKLPNSLQKIVEEIQKMSPAPRTYTQEFIPPNRYPPCVIHTLDLLTKSQNVPHYGRFLMTTYLLGIGKTVDEIIVLFPKVPDFNERVTRYQVEHLAGLKGGRTRYKAPSCSTLQTHSFCFKTVECDDIKNPIQFGRKRIHLDKKEEKQKRRIKQKPS